MSEETIPTFYCETCKEEVPAVINTFRHEKHDIEAQSVHCPFCEIVANIEDDIDLTQRPLSWFEKQGISVVKVEDN